jgi:hypothetical protein
VLAVVACAMTRIPIVLVSLCYTFLPAPVILRQFFLAK